MKRSLKYHIFETLDSTQVKAKQIPQEKQKIHVVCAYEQTHGQGTFGKTWVSPNQSGLYLTLAFEIGHLEHISSLSHLAACACCMSLEPISPTIKWPNDILIDGKKIAGVLTEVQGHRVYVGIGVNINFHKDLKAVTDQKVTAYSEHKTPPALEDILHYLSERFLDLLNLWEQGGFIKIKAIYEKYFPHLHKHVVIDTPDGLICGLLEGFSDKGYPIIKKNTELFEVTHLAHINSDETK